MSAVVAAPRRRRRRTASRRPTGALVLSVVVLALAATAPGAHAEGRPVAVVNLDLTNDPAPHELATQLHTVLRDHPELRTLPVPGDTAALYERIDDEDARRVASARRDLGAAEEQLEQFNATQAIRAAETGQRELRLVTPSLAVAAYADLSFVLGRALLDDKRPDEARLAFAHSHRLDPRRVLDPVGTHPEVVVAYEAAKAAADPPGAIEVRGTGNVWIDGAEVGLAPGTFAAAAGRHVVWLTGIDRETRGLAVEVAPGAATLAEIPDAEAPRRTKVQRARQALARAPDPTARAAAMRRLAALTGVADAILISASGGKLVVQTWRAGDVDRAPGFSALRERGAATPLELLAPLAPPVVVEPEEPPIRIQPPPPKRWYQRRSVQLSILGGVVAAVAAGIAISYARPDSFMFDSDIGNAPGSLGRR